jgi:hypothetical protein
VEWELHDQAREPAVRGKYRATYESGLPTISRAGVPRPSSARGAE